MYGAKAQEGQGKQDITTNQTEGFAVWEDPEGRFTIEYPSNWTAEGKGNRFEDIELRLWIPDIVNSSMLRLKTVIDFFNKGETSLFGNFSLNDLCNDTLNDLRQDRTEFDLEEPLNFTKYTIGGHEACSLLFTYRSSESDQIYVQHVIESLINGTEFFLAYHETPESYDLTLPLLNKIVNSIQVLKT